MPITWERNVLKFKFHWTKSKRSALLSFSFCGNLEIFLFFFILFFSLSELAFLQPQNGVNHR